MASVKSDQWEHHKYNQTDPHRPITTTNVPEILMYYILTGACYMFVYLPFAPIQGWFKRFGVYRSVFTHVTSFTFKISLLLLRSMVREYFRQNWLYSLCHVFQPSVAGNNGTLGEYLPTYRVRIQNILNYRIWYNCQPLARLKPKRCLGGFIFTL